MDKFPYAIITPDPLEECDYLVSPLEQRDSLNEIFRDCGEEIDGKTFRVKIVYRTKKWEEKIPEL